MKPVKFPDFRLERVYGRGLGSPGRLVLFVLLIIACVGMLCVGPGLSTARQSLVDLSRADTGVGLPAPRVVRVSEQGSIAIWDQALQRWLILDPEQIGSTKLKPREVWEQYRVSSRLGVIAGKEAPDGFWDDSHNFWSYFNGELQADSIAIQTVTSGTVTHRINGPVKDVINYGDRWMTHRQDGRLEIHDPYLSNQALEVLQPNFEGTVRGITERGNAIVRNDSQIVKYLGEDTAVRNTLDLEGEISVDGNTVYFYTGDRLARLGENLSVEFTYILPGASQILDLDIENNRLYVLTEDGLETGELPQQEAGMFGSSLKVELSGLIDSIRLPQQFHRSGDFWLARDGIRLRGMVWPARSVGRWFSNQSSQLQKINDKNLPVGLLQHRSNPHSYWHPDGTFYYYFGYEGAVEQYNLDGERLARIEVNPVQDAAKFFGVTTPKFVGANQDRLIFSVKAAIRGEGPRTVLMVYNRDGELLRAPRLQHPITTKGIPQFDSGNLVFGGKDRIYRLGTDQIGVYDLRGYPTHSILGVREPQSLRRFGDSLFILESGPRLISRDAPGSGTTRFGSLPANPSITSIYGGGYVVAATSYDRGTGRILEYNPENREIETVLKRDRETRFPAVSGDRSTLFFWERQEGGWRLMRSDRIRYQVRSTDQFVPILSKPRFVSRENGYLISKQSSESAGKILKADGSRLKVRADRPYQYLAPTADGQWFMVTPDPKDESFTVHLARSRRSADENIIHIEPYRTIMTVRDPVRKIKMGRQGTVTIATRPREGFTRLRRGTWNNVQAKDGLVFRGKVVPLRAMEGVRVLYRQTGGLDGYLTEWYPEGVNATGGLQGGYRVSGPVSVRGIKFWVQPSGEILETGRGGQFTASNLPVGQLKIQVLSNEFYMEDPFYVSVAGDEYTVLNSRELTHVDNELLSTGLERLIGNEFRTAQFAFTRFSEARMDGPEFHWARLLSEVVDWRQSDGAWKQKMLMERPEFLPPDERWAVTRRGLSRGLDRDALLEELLAGSFGLCRDWLLYRKVNETGEIPAHLNRPIYSPYTQLPSWWIQNG